MYLSIMEVTFVTIATEDSQRILSAPTIAKDLKRQLYTWPRTPLVTGLYQNKLKNEPFANLHHCWLVPG